MESIKKPRTANRPADFENGTVKTPDNTPFNVEALEAAAQRVRASVQAAKLRAKLTESTGAIQRVDLWDDKPTQDDILAFHDDASDLARRLVDPHESGNAD